MNRMWIWFFILSTSVCFAQQKYPLVICAVFKDETFFLKEWLEFHKLMGVSHFYLYNNSSTDNYAEILAPYLASGMVDLIDWPVETNNQKEYLQLLQLPVYNHALAITKETAEWAAFIDLDEFLCPVSHPSLLALLQEYENFSGLTVNWQTFGTSGIDKLQPGQSILENFIWKAPHWWEINKYIKMIVRPAHVKCFCKNPHYCQFEEGYFAVNSDKHPLDALREVQPILIDKIRIHHYWFGDRTWFIQHKLPRREKWGIAIAQEYLDQFIDSFNQERDETMLRLFDRLKHPFLRD